MSLVMAVVTFVISDFSWAHFQGYPFTVVGPALNCILLAVALMLVDSVENQIAHDQRLFPGQPCRQFCVLLQLCSVLSVLLLFWWTVILLQTE